MKANELMIGDWVKFPIGNDKVIDLPYIEGRGVCASFAASVTLFPVEVYKLEPIPLTPEILEKNGWISDNYIDRLHVYNLRHGKGYSTIAISDDGKLSIEVGAEIAKKDKRGRADLVTFIRDWCGGFCVHELQHALRLCGIEKEIVL